MAVGDYTNFGPKGPLKYRDVPGSMGVLGAREDGPLIGQADCFTWDADANAVSRLRIGGGPIEGRWLLVNWEFVRARESGRQPRG
jgi:hypothetical protein